MAPNTLIIKSVLRSLPRYSRSKYILDLNIFDIHIKKATFKKIKNLAYFHLQVFPIKCLFWLIIAKVFFKAKQVLHSLFTERTK